MMSVNEPSEIEWICSNSSECNRRTKEKRQAKLGRYWPALGKFFVYGKNEKRHYLKISANAFFWRTWGGQEIDLLEEREGGLFAYEFKYKESKAKIPKKFLSAYPQSSFQTISKENFLDFTV